MFLIKRLWIDSFENNNAYGFENIGVVATKEEADRICSLEKIPKTMYSWPLKNATEFKGDSVPRFIAEEIMEVGSLTIEQLKAL